MIVVDSSALLAALVARDKPDGLVERVANDALSAPHLLDVEMLSGLRRLVGTGELSNDRANDARSDFADLGILRYPHSGLSDRAWELRHNLSVYDAVYVALAEALEVPLVTCDGRIASSPGHRADVELFPPDLGAKTG